MRQDAEQVLPVEVGEIKYDEATSAVIAKFSDCEWKVPGMTPAQHKTIMSDSGHLHTAAPGKHGQKKLQKPWSMELSDRTALLIMDSNRNEKHSYVLWHMKGWPKEKPKAQIFEFKTTSTGVSKDVALEWMKDAARTWAKDPESKQRLDQQKKEFIKDNKVGLGPDCDTAKSTYGLQYFSLSSQMVKLQSDVWLPRNSDTTIYVMWLSVVLAQICKAGNDAASRPATIGDEAVEVDAEDDNDDDEEDAEQELLAAQAAAEAAKRSGIKRAGKAAAAKSQPAQPHGASTAVQAAAESAVEPQAKKPKGAAVARKPAAATAVQPMPSEEGAEAAESESLPAPSMAFDDM